MHLVKKPQRFLNEIKEYRLLSDNLLQLKFKGVGAVREGEAVAEFDLRVYEAVDARKIFEKLDYLLRIMLKKF